MTEISFVSTQDMLAFTDEGDLCEITNMFDEHGDETTCRSEAVFAVAKLDDNNWFTVDLSAFEQASMY